MQPDQLLRENVIVHKMLGPTSEPVIAFANYFRVQLGFWLVLLGVSTYLLTKTTYKETVAARGVLEPIQHTQKIISPVAARVEEVYVDQGELVQSGEVLASLSTGTYNEQGVSVAQENIRQLRVDRRLLEQELEIQQSARQQSQHWNRLASENIYQSKLSLEREAQLLNTRMELSDRNLGAVSTLLKSGNSSTREFDQYHQAHLELQGRMQTLSQRLLQYDYELDSLLHAERLAEFEARQAALRIQRELQTIEQRIRNIGNQALLTVIAEEAGIVEELSLEKGKPVLPNQPLFFINPPSTVLQATLYVPASIQGKLVVGQSVLLRYDAFDFRLYGRQVATVSTIGRVGLDPRETRLPFVGMSEPMFKVTAMLHRSTVQGQSLYKLQSGATLVADFVLAEMSLLEFVMKPILSLRGKVT